MCDQCNCTPCRQIIVRKTVQEPNWLNGSGVPSDSLGNDDNYYLNNDTGDVYQKTNGSWGSPIANLKGPQGDAGANGADGVNGTNGVNGANGVDGVDGQGVDHVSKTGGTGAPGTTDTYTLWGDASETINLGTFTVYNGADGAGGGITENTWQTLDITGRYNLGSIGFSRTNDNVTGNIKYLELGNILHVTIALTHSFTYTSGSHGVTSNYAISLTDVYSAITKTAEHQILDAGGIDLVHVTGGNNTLLQSPQQARSAITNDWAKLLCNELANATLNNGDNYSVLVYASFNIRLS